MGFGSLRLTAGQRSLTDARGRVRVESHFWAVCFIEKALQGYLSGRSIGDWVSARNATGRRARMRMMMISWIDDEVEDVQK